MLIRESRDVAGPGNTAHPLTCVPAGTRHWPGEGKGRGEASKPACPGKDDQERRKEAYG